MRCDGAAKSKEGLYKTALRAAMVSGLGTLAMSQRQEAEQQEAESEML